jgi:hypothetical protein
VALLKFGEGKAAAHGGVYHWILWPAQQATSGQSRPEQNGYRPSTGSFRLCLRPICSAAVRSRRGKERDVTADEARQLADIARAKRDLRVYLNTIEATAKDGGYSASFGAIDKRQAELFKLLGYKVMRRGQNVEVSWSVLPLT